MKRRMMAVAGVVVIVLIVVLAVVGGTTAAKTASVTEAASGAFANQKIQVSGNVVKDSFSTTDNVLTFSIYDPEVGDATQLKVRYDGAASSTFGNDVTAICTGTMGDDGVLACSELVTKCPSKYESAEDALTVSRLLDYGADIEGTVVKVAGTVSAGTLKAAGEGDRFVLADEMGSQVAVLFGGALSEGVAEGSTVVLTGSVTAEGKFEATDVALEG